MSFVANFPKIIKLQRTYEEGYQIGERHAPVLTEKFMKIFTLASCFTICAFPSHFQVLVKKVVEWSSLVFPLLASNNIFIGCLYLSAGISMTIGAFGMYNEIPKKLGNTKLVKVFFGKAMGLINLL
ncbi:MAG: hypothetical protein K940chlam5_00905 [Candidatus Anoxychlamydiales bacterium]|nr:hypothetical protein [Candidatus Anoxychlamydiales bacterium]